MILPVYGFLVFGKLIASLLQILAKKLNLFENILEELEH